MESQYVCSLLYLAPFTKHNAFEIHTCCVYQWFGPLNCWVVLQCLEIPLFIYPFIILWKIWLLPLFSYHAFKSKLSCRYLLKFVPDKYLGVGLLSHIEELSYSFPEWLYHFSCPPKMFHFFYILLRTWCCWSFSFYSDSGVYCSISLWF